MWPEFLVGGTKCLKFGSCQFRILGDPSPEAWNKAHRYASWMRYVDVDDWPVDAEDTYHKLRLNSPTGGWFPALQTLYWMVTETNLPHAAMFFSPHLERVSMCMSWSEGYDEVPLHVLPAIASAISALPTSALRSMYVGVGDDGAPLTYFEDSLSSVVLRCGPSLTEIHSPIRLSDAAMNHLIQLPHLRTLRVEGPPPSYSASSLPLVFPPLVDFKLCEGAAYGWLSLFKRLEHGGSVTQGMTPLSGMKGSLKQLGVKNRPGLIIDASFASPIQMFRNLATLNVDVYCIGQDSEGQCTFKLNDDNVTELAMALPQLESLLLGHPCSNNTCATTVACLLPISVHCIKLQSLQIHFNTTNIVDDIKNISGDPRFQDLHSLQRCSLPRLDVMKIPLTLDAPGIEIVRSGMVDIFPSVGYFTWCGGIWSWGALNDELRRV